MIDSPYFTQQQAAALVGRHVRARLHWSGIPGGAWGIITGATESPTGWGVVIDWNLPPPIKKLTDAVAFARADYERALEEIAW